MRKMTKGEIAAALLCNTFTVLHLAVLVSTLVFLPGWAWKTGGFLAALYFLPLACARLALLVHPLRPGKIPIGTRAYYVWWFVFCTQNLYNRFPQLEEVLRCLPGVYSLWLRLWGAKIGRLTYWSAGTIVLDRPLLVVGDHCGFGVGVRLAAHVHVENELWLEPPVVEGHVVVGAYSLLGPGTVLKANQSTKAFLISPPYSVWQDNKRIAK